MHVYQLKGKQYPSVTYILDKTDPKSEIIKWGKRKERYELRYGVGSWEENKRQSRDRGVAFHKAIAAILEGKPPNCNEAMQPYLQSVLTFFEQLPSFEPLEVETKIVSTQHGYGGTFDCLIRFGDKVHLWDFKTFQGYENPVTGKIYKQWKVWKNPKKTSLSPDWASIDDKTKKAFLQCCFYRLAAIENNKQVDEIWTIVVTPYGVQHIPLYPSIWADCYQEAIDRLRFFKEKYYQEWEQEKRNSKWIECYKLVI